VTESEATVEDFVEWANDLLDKAEYLIDGVEGLQSDRWREGRKIFKLEYGKYLNLSGND
jgi:hypothetical protein